MRHTFVPLFHRVFAFFNKNFQFSSTPRYSVKTITFDEIKTLPCPWYDATYINFPFSREPSKFSPNETTFDYVLTLAIVIVLVAALRWTKTDRRMAACIIEIIIVSSAGGTSSRVEGPKPLGRHARNTHATHTHSLFLTHGILLFMIALSLSLSLSFSLSISLSISFSSRLPLISSLEMLPRFRLLVTFLHGD